MGNGIASWPSNSLLIPATTSVITITLSAALWEKHCWQKDLQIMITLWIAYCTQHRVQRISGHSTHQISLYSVLAHNNTNHQECMLARCTVSILGCFWDIARGKIHPLFYLLVSEWLIVIGSSPASRSGLNRRQTAGRTHANWASLAVCQGFIKAARVGRGMRVNIMCMYCLCVCVSVVLLYVNLHQSLYLWSECCKLLSQLYSVKDCTIYIKTITACQTKPHYQVQISCEEHLEPCFDRFIDCIWHWSPCFCCGSLSPVIG